MITRRLALSALLCAMPFAAVAGSAAVADETIAIDPSAASQVSLVAALQSALPPGASVVGFGAWNGSSIAPAVDVIEGTALLDLGGETPVPVRFNATLDTPSQQVISFTYRLADPGDREGAAAQEAALGRSLSDQIGRKLLEEFADQPVDFALIELTAIRHSPKAIIMQGYGMADFHHEGHAEVTFIATFDRTSSRLHALQYELAAPADDVEWPGAQRVVQAGE